MDIDEKIHLELLKRLKKFSESIISDMSPGNLNNSNSISHKRHSLEKTDPNKRYKKRFTSFYKQMKKLNLCNSIYSPKNNHHTNITFNFFGETQLYEKVLNKSQDKPIKMNLVSQKFRIADDFNEKNSNQFLYEKDECLREVFLSDEIEEEKCTHISIDKKRKKNRNKSFISKKNKISDNLNKKNKKRKSLKDDSDKYLSGLIEKMK